jgi:nucleoside-diphosphate-sugar epimerase
MTAHAHDILTGKRLVIFGCGYVGSEVARRAQQRGLQVTALTRNAEKAGRLRSDGIEVIEAELASDRWHDRIPGGADFVLNSVSSGGSGVEGYRRSYVDGMTSILAWARRTPIGTFAYTSSTSVYPQGGGDRVTETSLVEPRSESARVLIEAENLIVSAGDEGSRPMGRWFIFRLAGIYGPGRHHLLDQLRSGATELSGAPDHHLNLIHRDDAAEAVLAGFATPPTMQDEIFNLADDHAATKAEVTAWLAGRLLIPVPSFTGATTGRRGAVPDRVIVNRKARQRLDWRPEFPDYRAGYEKILSL